MMALYKPLPLGVLKTIEATSNSTSQPPKAFWINLPKALSVPKRQATASLHATHDVHSQYKQWHVESEIASTWSVQKKNKIHPHNRLMPSNTF